MNEPIIMDVKYIGVDGGARVYTEIAPTITARDYKDPLRVIVYEESNSCPDGTFGEPGGWKDMTGTYGYDICPPIKARDYKDPLRVVYTETESELLMATDGTDADGNIV